MYSMTLYVCLSVRYMIPMEILQIKGYLALTSRQHYGTALHTVQAPTCEHDQSGQGIKLPANTHPTPTNKDSAVFRTRRGRG